MAYFYSKEIKRYIFLEVLKFFGAVVLIIALTYILVGCNPTETAMSAANHFVRSVNNRDEVALDKITGEAFLSERGIHCAQSYNCQGKVVGDICWAVTQTHPRCTNSYVYQEWAEFVNGMQGVGLLPCQLESVYAYGAKKDRATASVICGGFRDKIGLVQDTDGWRLDGNWRYTMLMYSEFLKRRVAQR